MQNGNFLVVSKEVNAVLPACLFSGREKDSPCLSSDEHWKILSEYAEHRPGESTTWCLCYCWYLFSPFFQGHNNLECRITQIQVDLWWIPWLWLSTSSPIPHKETRFTHPHLPIATHHLPPMSRWWNPPREDSGSLTWLCKKVQLQNDRDGGLLPFWTLASSPGPLAFPSLHFSSLKLLAKGWFLKFFFLFFFFSRSGFFLCLQNERSCLCNAFNGNLYLKPVCLSLYLLFVSIKVLIVLWQVTESSSCNPRVMCSLLRHHRRNSLS